MCRETVPEITKKELVDNILELLDGKTEVDDIVLEKVSGGKMTNKFLTTALSGLLMFSFATSNLKVNAVGGDDEVNAKLFRTIQEINLDKLQLVHSSRELYDYLKTIDNSLSEDDYVKYINVLSEGLPDRQFLGLFNAIVDESIKSGKSKFEAVSDGLDISLQKLKLNYVVLLRFLSVYFINDHYTEYIDHLTLDKKGIAINRSARNRAIKKFVELPKHIKNVNYSFDFRCSDFSGMDLKDCEDLDFADFDTKTIWPTRDKLLENFDPQAILENGKNPVLGIRDLHRQGVNGKNVGVAILDQMLLSSHEEYKDKLKLYEEIAVSRIKGSDGSDELNSPPEMHAPAVASIAVGKNCGVAPEADLYQIGSSVGVGFSNQAKVAVRAIDRILEINRTLPNEKKIRVISISQGFGTYINDYSEFKAKVREAKERGVFAITTSVSEDHDFNMDIKGLSRSEDPDQSSNYRFGDTWDEENYAKDGYFNRATLLVPMGNRTFASYMGNNEYQHDYDGGYSWMIPWLASCYALCCQVNPDITPELFMQVAFDTGDILNDTSENTLADKNNAKIINPQRLIERLKTLNS